MKRIEELMVSAFNGNRNFKMTNTEVVISNGIKKVYLFDNLICKVVNGKKLFSNAGWNSVTTRSRLCALGCDCRIKNRKLIRTDGKEFDF